MGTDPRALALLFAGMMDTHVMAMFQQPDAELSEELAESLVHHFFHGAGRPC